MNELFERLIKNVGEIKEKTKNVINASRNNTWKKRAERVAEDLAK